MGVRVGRHLEGPLTDELADLLPGGTADRIFTFENVASLHVLIWLLVANGGEEILVGEHGVLPEGLPQVPQGSLSQLVRNRYLTTAPQGVGLRVGLGSRTREIAKRWAIELAFADGNER